MAETGGRGKGPGAEQVAPGGTSNILPRVTILLFIVAVILGECLVAYVFIGRSGGETAAAAPSQDGDAKEEKGSSAEQTKTGPESLPPKDAHAKSAHGTSSTGKGSHGTGGGHGKKETKGTLTEMAGGGESSLDQLEVDLEQFTVTAHQPTSDTTIRVEFHLYGIISPSDQGEFERRMKGAQQRFREQVLVTVRGAEPADLVEAELGLIKRQILEKTNALLGKPLLKAVIITDFSHFQQ